ncbi:MAG: hypothetical protein IJW23_11455 [Lentisphaeria bacterium]|nr:hypothetical protein [Lentisphaeria bacterium]
MEPFAIRGFNPCESLLRHTPEQLRRFLRRMKTLNMNSIIIHYDYGWQRYKELIMEECAAANINIILMTFGPRTFLSYSNWKKEWFAKNPEGKPYCDRLECESYPCRYEQEALEAYAYGAREWLKSLPPQIKHVHMRAADGIMFCQCEKCRLLTDHEKWQPFVDIFAEAVMEVRPDLAFETDIYVKRYHIPGNQVPFRNMKNIMYDTFYRTTNFPLGYGNYESPALEWAKTVYDTDTTSRTPNEYHLARLKEWTSTFPGKVYIHENSMAQSLHGVFTHCTSTNLADLETYRKIGVQGVCYEAYEPGYVNFAEMFEVLARALNGEKVEWQRTPMEDFCRDRQLSYTWKEATEEDIDRMIADPVKRQHAKLERAFWNTLSLKNAKEYMKFAFDHEDTLDPIFISSSLIQAGPRTKAYFYPDMTPMEKDFLTRRKLWDFMEDIPMDQDPIAVCKNLVLGMMDKAVEG